VPPRSLDRLRARLSTIAAFVAVSACHKPASDGAEAGAPSSVAPPPTVDPSSGDPDAAFTSAAGAFADLPDSGATEARDGGAEPAFPNVPVGEPLPGFRRASLEPAQLAKIFSTVPELVRIGRELRYFTEGDVKAIAARSGAAHDGITFMTAPILWSPESGAELLVAAGRGKTMSFVVALWTLPNEQYRFGSAFLMLNDLSPVVLAYEPARRKELRWTSCWGCPGEQGNVSYRPEDHRVVIVQQ
jgi:hypothetical protein